MPTDRPDTPPPQDSSAGPDIEFDATLPLHGRKRPSDAIDLETAATIAAPTKGDTSVGTSGPIPSAVPSAPMPETIGRYKILGKLGEGGMGIVYEAEQQNPKRRVALKVIRGGRFVDEGTIRLFRREAETLARLRHPNIGGIYESGHTEDGQHYFVMELVQGDTLDTFLSKRPPITSRDELRFRLALFRRIADAVHYAHQRGVIHRDLKPSNIIVSRETDSDASIVTLAGARLPELKILDFGLARITEGDVQVTAVTEVGAIKGTLPYMSPEQARGQAEAIDVRTDVYALGVILYEMLSGTRPYDLSRTSLVEAVRQICESPPRSLRTTLSGTRRLDPDIETMVGKALEKDADHRYASAAAMSEDVERYLSSQPILARPPSTIYQVQKFATRNRALVGGIAATFVVLVAGVVVSTLQAMRATRAEALATERMAAAVAAEARARAGTREALAQRAVADSQRTVAEQERGIAATQRRVAVANGERAHMEAAKAGAINRFLQDMLATADPWAGDAGKVTLDAALDQAQKRLGTWAGNDPDVDCAIRGTLASAFAGVGRYGEAEDLLRGALDSHNGGADVDPALVAGIHRQLGALMIQTSRYDGAESQFRQALASQAFAGSAVSDTVAMINAQLASALAYQGRYASADSVARSASEMVKAIGSGSSLAAPEILRTRAYIETNWKENQAAADAMLREAIAQFRTRPGDGPIKASDALEELAGIRVRMGDLVNADSLYREAVTLRKNTLGESHPLVARALENQGNYLYRTGRVDQTIDVLQQVLAIRQRGAGPESAPVGRTWISLGPVYAKAKRMKESETAFENGLRILRKTLGPKHPDLAPALLAYSDMRVKQKRLDAAEKLAREALGIRMEALGAGNSGTIACQVGLADILRVRGTSTLYKEAEALLLAARSAGVAARGSSDPGAIKATQALIQLYDAWGKPAESRKWRAAS